VPTIDPTIQPSGARGLVNKPYFTLLNYVNTNIQKILFYVKKKIKINAICENKVFNIFEDLFPKLK